MAGLLGTLWLPGHHQHAGGQDGDLDDMVKQLMPSNGGSDEEILRKLPCMSCICENHGVLDVKSNMPVKVIAT